MQQKCKKMDRYYSLYNITVWQKCRKMDRLLRGFADMFGGGICYVYYRKVIKNASNLVKTEEKFVYIRKKQYLCTIILSDLRSFRASVTKMMRTYK